MNYRSPTLLRLAKDCPHCMCCGTPNDGTVVAAHSNKQKHGKGISIKAHDLVAYLCHYCHDRLDGRTQGWDALQKEQVFQEAFYQTMLWLFKEGHLTVHSKPARTA